MSAGPATDAPGRSCPLAYRYPARVFQRPPELQADTLYVVGGLYGNPHALDRIEALFALESGTKQMVFNGDFHWFDNDPALFADIDRRVQRHRALRGNVETELASDSNDVGCGCAYPTHVDDADVARSNAILALLRDTARQHPEARAALGRLPPHARAQVGQAQVAIVHGDAESLAGWGFDPAALADPAQQPWRERVAAQAGVDLFASSHTCAPTLQRLAGATWVANNGSAGLASLPGQTAGIVTRISVRPAPAGVPVLQSAQVQGVWVQALRVDFDDAAWQRRFLALWPIGSPAHVSYWHRVTQGLACTPPAALSESGASADPQLD